jgi:antitoxin component YwqK of YwqJK toxin-antitoxin module
MIRSVFILLTLKLLIVSNPNPVNAEYKKDNLSDGDHKYYYANGSVSVILKVKDQNIQGDYFTFYKNGNKREVLYFDNGHFNNINDTNKIYFENGNVEWEEVYRHDTLLYVCDHFYNRNGSKESLRWLTFDVDSLQICPFSKSKTTLNFIDFDMELTVKDMKSHGKSISYYKNGNLKEETDLINNKMEGDDRCYYDDGKLFSLGTYHNDLAEGVFTCYAEDGTITKTETWSNGKLIKK